jgi:hypothetical protein
MAFQVASLSLLLALSGCCLTVSSGFTLETTSSGVFATADSTGSTSGGSGTTATGATTSRTNGSATAGGGNTGTGGFASSSGTTTGSHTTPLSPTWLIDAGPGMVFGPVSASLVDPTYNQAVELAFAAGDGGIFGIATQAIGGDGTALGSATVVATTNPGLTAPPRTTTLGPDTICWEDFGVTDDPFGFCSTYDAGPRVLCGTLFGGSLDPRFNCCGSSPSLVHAPGASLSDLFFSFPAGLDQWWFGEAEGTSVHFYLATPAALVILSSETLGFVFADDSTGGLHLGSACSTNGGCVFFLANLDPTFAFGGAFAASADTIFTEPRGLVGLVELDGSGLRGTVWSSQTDGGTTVPIVSTATPVGPLAVGSCAGGFGYVVMTSSPGILLFAEQGFDGGMLADSGSLYELEGLESGPTAITASAIPDSGLLVALSSSGQVAVYKIPCE